MLITIVEYFLNAGNVKKMTVVKYIELYSYLCEAIVKRSTFAVATSFLFHKYIERLF